jgi:hypothetical protein
MRIRAEKEQGLEAQSGLWLLGVVLFSLLSLAYAGHGMVLLFRGHTGLPDDFMRRWREQRYVLFFTNPYDVRFTRGVRMGENLPTIAFRHVEENPEIGALDIIGYPPWTYATGIVLHSFALRWARLQYALINLFAVAVIGLWVLQRAPYGAPCMSKLMLPLMALGTMPVWCTLAYGQYGVLLIAMLAWSLSLSYAGKSVLSGVLLGMAMLKPTFTLPFCLILVHRRDLRSLAVGAAYVVLGGLGVCALTTTGPQRFLSQMQADAVGVALDMPSLLKGLVVALKIPLQVALPGLILIFLVLTWWWIVYVSHRATLLDHMAIAGLAARLFTYHRPYDDLLLVFLLLALAIRCMNRPTPSLIMSLLVVGLSLWLPLGFGWKWPFAAMQHVCWVWGAGALSWDILTKDRDPFVPSEVHTL